MKILVIPDTQIKPEVELQYLNCIGQYIVDTKPDHIVMLGDLADFQSISTHNTPYEQEGLRLIDDLNAARTGLGLLMQPMGEYNEHMREIKKKMYRPKLHITLGNHEDRLTRYLHGHPELVGLIGEDVLGLGEYGFNVVPYKEVLTIEGVNFCHIFQTTANGNPPSSARALLNKRVTSCIMGHRQGLDWAHTYTPDGKKISCIICGSCYDHDEPYMMQMNRTHWRGLIMLDNVQDGSFDECFIPLRWIKDTYNFNEDESWTYVSNRRAGASEPEFGIMEGVGVINEDNLEDDDGNTD